MASQTDSEGYVLTYTYDALDRVVQVGHPDGTSQTLTNGNGNVTTWARDLESRITSTSVGTNANTQTSTYDSLGRVTNKTNPLGSFTYQYLGDSGQVTSQQLAGGMDTVYRYGDNSQDRRLKAIMNQPSIKTKPSDGSAPRDWRYHSTAEHLILGRKSNPGQPQGLHYDDAYRLIGTTQGLALGTTLGEDEFVSDGTVGTPNPGNWRSGYAYDAADNLTQASSETNPAGNWIATPNNLNQIASKGGNSWVYDAAGNLLDDGVRSYEWDAQQRLIALTDKATGRKSEFAYDGNSRLTITKEYPAGSTTASETRYLWCGHKVCQARDGQDNVTARYFDEGEIKTSNTGSTALYYTKDHLGSVMETTQASGRVLGSLDYGPYGEPEKAQGQLPDFRYAGMLHHAPTGLYLTHYRAYDPSVGRWLNRDPIEESGGINLYGYVGGNPLSHVDPLGLDFDITDASAVPSGEYQSISPLQGTLTPNTKQKCLLKCALYSQVTGVVVTGVLGGLSYGALAVGLVPGVTVTGAVIIGYQVYKQYGRYYTLVKIAHTSNKCFQECLQCK